MNPACSKWRSVDNASAISLSRISKKLTASSALNPDISQEKRNRGQKPARMQ
jgi:hypothetical protein